jgi:hypothetical protein
MGVRNYRPTSRRTTWRQRQRLCGTDSGAPSRRRVVAEAAAQKGRAQQSRARSPPVIAAVVTSGCTGGRLPPGKRRRAGQGPFDPVRSEPQCPDRLAALRGRRETLHFGTRRTQAGDRVENGPTRRRRSATACRSSGFRWERIHNIEMLPGQGARLCRSAGRMRRLMAREGRPGRRSRCPAAKSAACRPSVGPRSARWATRIT